MTFTWTLWLALFGLIFGHGLPGAVVGGITGFIIDSLRKGQRSRVTPEAGGYISPLFNVLGAVAKSDGRVSEAEIAVAVQPGQAARVQREPRHRGAAPLGRAAS
jgi:DnaJ like chaperone protein